MQKRKFPNTGKKSMLRAVLDTNAFVSAVIAKGNESELLMAAHRGDFKLVTSLEILNEFKDVISRPKFGFSKEQIQNVLLHIIEAAEIVQPNIKLDIVKEDPDDNKIIECAVFSKADFIVSGDRHLLKLKRTDGIAIIRSAELLNQLRKS